MSEFRKKHREQAEETTLRALKKYGCLLGQYIPANVRKSLLKKELIAEVQRLYFGPREWLFRLTPAGYRAVETLPPIKN